MRNHHCLLWLVVVLLGISCSRGDPPCPPGAREVGIQEADDAFGRRAVREVQKGQGDLEAALYRCIDVSNGKIDDAFVTFKHVEECVQVVQTRAVLNRPITLMQCLAVIAKDFYYAKLWPMGGWDSAEHHAQTLDGLKTATSPMSNVDCNEHYRAVDIEAEKHGLNRTGPEQWVPAILWLLLNNADKAMAPAGAPLLFLIKPGRGVEEACVDLPAEPSRKCTAAGCDELPTGGVESPDAGSIVLPPGVTPGDTGGSGDFP